VNFLSHLIEKYCDNNTQAEDPVLHQLFRETHLKVLRSRMLSGHNQGVLLTLLSKLAKPKTILELGTYTGYSAICLAKGLQENGKLYTIDINEELEPFAERFFKLAKLDDKIEQHIGKALDIIPTLKGTFDLVFMDADKKNYLNYLDIIEDRMPSGALLLVDNVLWSGKVVEEINPKDIDTPVLVELNKRITDSPKWENVLIPIRDGIMMAIRN